jgi:hypothetical protein
MKALEANFPAIHAIQKLDNDMKQTIPKKEMLCLEFPQNPEGYFPPSQNRKGFYIYTSTPRALMDSKKPFRVGKNFQR